MDEELEDKEVYLCFVRLIGKENDGYYQYEFIFTDNIDEVWGEDFNQKPACLVNNLMISEEYITEVHTVKTKIKFDLIQDNCCFSVSDCYDGIIALAWEDISQYEEYPEDGRLFFKFGESIDDVDDKLARKHIIMSSYNL
jgi:hypothetical protein